jgi:CheY-like chemotaxis protein
MLFYQTSNYDIIKKAMKVLVVDDNQLLLQALCEALEDKGFDTSVATNGKEALEQIEKERPDLVIMDIVMPVMNGIDATKAIRANPQYKGLPVVAFTSKSNIGQWDEIFDDYLIKPFDFDNVLRIIERFIAKSKSSFF